MPSKNTPSHSRSRNGFHFAASFSRPEGLTLQIRVSTTVLLTLIPLLSGIGAAIGRALGVV